MKIADIIEQVNKRQSPRDNAFQNTSDNIWDKDRLKEMGRMDKHQIVDVLRNIVVIMVYEQTWNENYVNHEIIKIKGYPYYRIKTEEKRKPIDIPKFLEESKHMLIINSAMELFIGRDGLGRDEIFKFLTAMNIQAAEEARKANTAVEL